MCFHWTNVQAFETFWSHGAWRIVSRWRVWTQDQLNTSLCTKVVYTIPLECISNVLCLSIAKNRTVNEMCCAADNINNILINVRDIDNRKIYVDLVIAFVIYVPWRHMWYITSSSWSSARFASFKDKYKCLLHLWITTTLIFPYCSRFTYWCMKEAVYLRSRY